MRQVRSFIAVELPEEMMKRIYSIVLEASKAGGNIKWVEERNLHLTLKFLGNVPEEMIPTVSAVIDSVASAFEPFEFNVVGVGGFPNLTRPRVIWVGVSDAQHLLRLQRQIEEAMERLGFQREEKEFHPHITIGRVKSHHGIGKVIEALRKHEGEQLGRVEVKQITLMRSDLSPSGPTYTPISRHNLSCHQSHG